MTESHPEITLADVTWLTALARSLVQDGTTADDLVQETWVAAAESPPRDGEVNRPWLGRVLKNLHLKSLRSRRRRTRREQVASKPEAAPSTEELIERAELRRTLADCLLNLDEPYRRTLMLVAFEGYSTAEISERDGVSVGVVRHRLRKARELYKQKLEREHGREWKHWYAALLPYAELPLPGDVAVGSATAAASTARTSTTLIGGLLVSKTLLVTGAASGLVGLALLGTSSWTEPTPDLERSVTADPLRTTGTVPIDAGPEARTRREITSSESTDPSSASAASPYVLSGTVVIRDESGVEYSRTNGEFDLQVSNGGESENVSVPVVDGMWQLDFPAGQEWSVQTNVIVVLDGRAGELTTRATATVPEDSELALEAKWYARHQIDVLDSETRQHLNSVEIRAVANSLDRFSTPGLLRESSVICRDQRSPVQLAPRTSVEWDYFVGCEGYAWTRIRVLADQGGRSEVLLDRGADLTVRFASGRAGVHTGPADVRIHVAADPTNEWAVETNTDDGVTLTGLPTGRYVVEARAHRTAKVVRREIDVAPGPNGVLLEIPESQQVRVPVAGTLVVPEQFEADYTMRITQRAPPTESMCFAWNSSAAWKVIRLSEMKRTDREHRFDAGRLPTGSYDVSLDGLDVWSTNFEVGPDGATDLRFELPSVGTTSVRLLDATTGDVITNQTAGFGPSWDFGDEVQATFDASSQLWKLTGPIGRAQGQVVSMDHEPSDVVLELRAEQPTEQEISLESRTYFTFAFYDGKERIVQWTDYFERCEVEQLRGSPAEPKVSYCGQGICFYLSEPGTFSVSFPEIEGYAPIPDQTVAVRKGERKLVDITLRRSR